jgi:hypothetical protein
MARPFSERYGLLALMAKRVVSAYGLGEHQLDLATRRHIAAGKIKLIRDIARPVTEFLTREGILLMLKRLGAEMGARSVARWVPLVGQAVASYLGYEISISFGMQLIDDCEKAIMGVSKVLLSGCCCGSPLGPNRFPRRAAASPGRGHWPISAVSPRPSRRPRK